MVRSVTSHPRLTIAIDPGEKASFERAASSVGLSLSAFVLAATRAEAARLKRPGVRKGACKQCGCPTNDPDGHCNSCSLW